MSRTRKILLRLEKEEAEKKAARTEALKKARLQVIFTCADCNHSQDRDACYHPDTPGRTDIYGVAPRQDGSGHPYTCFRPLPSLGPGIAGWPQNQPPPEWCPLPKAEGKVE